MRADWYNTGSVRQLRGLLLGHGELHDRGKLRRNAMVLPRKEPMPRHVRRQVSERHNMQC